jgi:hypothetical protein
MSAYAVIIGGKSIWWHQIQINPKKHTRQVNRTRKATSDLIYLHHRPTLQIPNKNILSKVRYEMADKVNKQRNLRHRLIAVSSAVAIITTT